MAIILRMAPTLPDRIITRPSAPRMTPQISLIFTDGRCEPPVENIARTYAALTTLVTIKRNAAMVVARVVSHDKGIFCSSRNVVWLILFWTTAGSSWLAAP